MCDQTHIQQVLPQVLIGDKRALTEKLMRQVEAPAAVHGMAEATSWNTSAVMVKTIGLVADAVQPHRKKFDPLLVLDCCVRHLAKPVL